jgi:N6-adenosine-specific RNA methylase IME4
MSTAMMQTSAITVGERHRRDLGDIDAMARNISEVGLLQPIAVDPTGTLIDGARRIEAIKRLGWESVPVHVVDIDAIVRGELAANIYRKDFTPSEMVAIAETIERRERELARQRMTLGKISTGSGNGKTRDKVAAPLGVSGRTLERAKQVVHAAAADPGRFGKLKADMDRTGRVNGIFRRLGVIRQEARIRAESPPLPNRGPYRVICADPPWPYDFRREDPSQRGVTPYPQMSLDEIRALQVASLAHGDCVLWLWSTSFHMPHAYQMLQAWGFAPMTLLTWVKDRMGTGTWLRGKTEHCLMAVRGKPLVHLTNQTTVLHAPVRAHSQKPDEFYEMVEKLCPAPRYASLFSRNQRRRWDAHGDEVPAPTPTILRPSSSRYPASLRTLTRRNVTKASQRSPTGTKD